MKQSASSRSTFLLKLNIIQTISANQFLVGFEPSGNEILGQASSMKGEITIITTIHLSGSITNLTIIVPDMDPLFALLFGFLLPSLDGPVPSQLPLIVTIIHSNQLRVLWICEIKYAKLELSIW